jgi:hypothetical protein
MEFHLPEVKELVGLVAEARRKAYAAAPRDSNDHIEAALFVAMLAAVNDYVGRQEEAPAAPPAEPEPIVMTEAEPEPALPVFDKAEPEAQGATSEPEAMPAFNIPPPRV